MLVNIRDHRDITTSEWDSLDNARRMLKLAQSSADTYGTVYYSDADTFYGHCNEHSELPNNVACFAGAITR